jgi:glycosyltransferase involved in cell wall biosynthesis
MSGCEPGMNRVLLVLASSDGGVIRHVADLAAGLAAAGDRVLVAGPVTAAQLGEGAGVGRVGVERVDIADRPRPVRDLRAVLRLRRLARRADLLHAHGLRAGAMSVLATTGLRGGPARVVTLPALIDGGPGTSAAVHGTLERIVARGADVVLAVSPDIAERMLELGARQVEAAVVAAPPDVGTGIGAGVGTARQHDATRQALRQSLGAPDGAALLVTVARLAPRGPPPRRRAGRLPVLPGPAVPAVVAGDGPADPLRRDAQARDLPRGCSAGGTTSATRLAAADPSSSPASGGASLAVQEALRAGAAIVATRAGGTERLTGDGAVLVPPRDHAALAAAIAELLDDEEAREELRRRARRRSEALPTAADAIAAARAAHRRARPGVSARGGRTGGDD